MSSIASLPPAVQNYVSEFRARRRRFALLKATGLAASFALAWMLLWCLVDRFTPLPAGLRLALLLIQLGAITVLLFRPLREALRRRVDWVEVTEDIEHRNAHFGQRLETVTSRLLDREEYRGSQAILDELVREVTATVEVDQPRALVPWRLAARPWIVTGIILLLMLALMAIPWLNLGTLVRRFATPLKEIGPVTTTQLAVSPGDQDVPQGDELQVSVEASHLGSTGGRDGRGGVAKIHLGDDAPPGSPAQQWSVATMTALSSNRFNFTIASVDHDLQYFVSAGDAVSRHYHVRVLRRPGISEFRIHYTYPAYTSKPPLTVSNNDGLIEAPKGTEASIAVVSTEPLSSAQLIIAGSTIPMSATVEENVRQANIPVEKEQAYTLEMLSTRNVKASGPPQMLIHAIPDRPPLVRLLQPGDDLRLHPRDILPLQYEALDDYGIASLAVQVQVNAAPAREAPIRVRGDARRQDGEFNLDLATMDLKVGDVVSFAIRAQDRAGQKSLSDMRHVLVSPRSIDLNTHLRIAELHEALLYADLLVAEWDGATKSLQEIRALGAAWLGGGSKLDQNVSAAAEASSLLGQRLLRAMIRGNSQSFSDTCATLLDQLQGQSIFADDMTNMLGSPKVQLDDTWNRLAAALAQARALQGSVKLLYQGEQAAAVLADRNNLQAARKLPATNKSTSDRLHETLARAEQDIADAAKELQLNPAAPDLDAQLQQKIAAAQQFMQQQHPIDFSPLVQQWLAELGKALDWHVGLDRRLVAAAQSEAVRPDGDLIYARDLQLCSRASAAISAQAFGFGTGATTQPAIIEPMRDYPPAMLALQKEHDLNRRPNDVRPPAEVSAIRTAASDARKKMTRWAGELQLATTQPADDEPSDELAMTANAEAASKKYDKAHALDQQLAAARAAGRTRSSRATSQPDADQMQAGPGSKTPGALGTGGKQQPDDSAVARNGDNPWKPKPRDRQRQVDQAMTAARAIDQIAEKQQKLNAETAAAKEEQAPGLGQRQGEVAEEIAKVQQEEENAQNPDAPAEQRENRNTRDRAMAAIQAAQERLAAMPQQLIAAQQSADAERQAFTRADAARKAAAATPQERAAAANKAAEQAEKDLADAKAKLADAQQPVLPDASQSISVKLNDFQPETLGAVNAIDQQLTPALRLLEQAIAARDAAGVERSAGQSRQAIEAVQAELRKAMDELNQRDPLVAAKWFAKAAASALQRRPPDLNAARTNQQNATAALTRAWDSSIHQAAADRLAGTRSMQSLYTITLALDGGAGSGVGVAPTSIIGAAPGAREWGRFRERPADDLNSSLRDADPPGYEDSLKLYFDAISKAQEGAAKK